MSDVSTFGVCIDEFYLSGENFQVKVVGKIKKKQFLVKYTFFS